ncbi:hypothetical protein ACH5RR_018019 [Cinchona calisaya]|uniref:RNase H type-1 domain-containing protein n=1 Tax=Cinchona calisaya TaxID=153742 RepID=A0ABD2ZNV3_9GENT
MASILNRITVTPAAKLAEILAGREAALIAQRFNNTRVILEGDDAGVIKTLREDENNLSTFGNLLDKVKSSVQHVSNLELNWVNRQSNMVVPILAQLAKVQSLGNWDDYPPDFLCMALHVDL